MTEPQLGVWELELPLPKRLGSGAGNFLAGADVPEKGSVVTISDEPRIVPSNFTAPDGSPQQRCRVGVRLPNKKEKLWTMNNTTYRILLAEFGEDEKAWIGKKVKLSKVRSMVRGELRDIIYGEPA
jgi:hypothetical protein